MTVVAALDGTTAVEDHGYRPAPAGVRANMMFSADGAAAFRGRAGPLSSPADQRLLLALRAYADVILVGAGTARAEKYGPVRLSPEHHAQRRQLGLSEAPPPIAVVSGSGRVPDTILDSPTPPILITSARGAGQATRQSDCRTLVFGDDSVDVARAVEGLREEGMHRILCEGGPTLLDTLVTADLVDELCVTLAPRLVGNQPVGGGTPADIASPVRLHLDQVLADPDGYLFMTYRRA